MQDNLLLSSLPGALALAYIGDAVHSLYIRRMLVERGITRPAELNKISLMYVTAEAQAASYSRIEQMLTDKEREIFKYASNSTHLNKPKRASGKDYRMATGFEAILGMLEYIGDRERLLALLKLSCDENGGTDNDTEN